MCVGNWITLLYIWNQHNIIQLYFNYSFHENKKKKEHLPGSPVVKNTPAHAGDVGSNLNLGRFHMLGSNRARAMCHNYWACALQQETPLQWEAPTLQLESRSRLLQLEKAYTAVKT